MSPRERLLRIGAGIGLIVGGCVAFSISKAHDPENRAAILAILAILAGFSFLGQGIRGHKEGPIQRPADVPAGPPISAERTLVGILGAWVLPGLGHWLIGRRTKAILFFVTVTVLFLAGVAFAHGRNLSYERDSIYFLAYMFNLGETALGWLLTRDLELTHRIPYLQLGFLYTAVACLLNLVVLMDFISTCARSAHVGHDRPDEAGTEAATATKEEGSAS